MNLQPLYDVKERLEYAAIAGVSLIGEDFRLQRAAEGLKPLAAASPVFGKIDGGLAKLLSAPPEQRPGLLLDVLALVDAVAYTQAKAGVEGDLEPLPAGGGRYYQISYKQIQPLLTALTTTGGGRVEAVRSAWDSCRDYFLDYRVLPALVGGLGDSYGEMAGLCAALLKKLGPDVVPMLKQGFDPAGKKEMARRVEIVAAVEQEKANPWLLDILPEAKRDVRVAVLLALGNDADNTARLLELAKSEKSGGNREAVLTSLAKQDGDAVAAFWAAELKVNFGSIRFLKETEAEWASELVASGLRERLEQLRAHGDAVSEEEQREISNWCYAVGKKASPVMVDFWRWADSRMEEFDRFTNKKGNPVFMGVRLTDTLRDCVRLAGPGPLRDFCLTLFDNHPSMTRYLQISFLAALLSRPAAEVYEKYSPYVLTKKPLLDADRKKTLNTVLLRSLEDVWWYPQGERYHVYGGQDTAKPFDRRWVERLTHAVYTDIQGKRVSPFAYYWEDVCVFDMTLMKLVNPKDEESRRVLVPYLRKRMKETGLAYHYSRWLLQLGGSPRGLLGDAMEKNPKANHLYVVWNLLFEASKVLPAGEVADLLGEISVPKAIHKGTQAKAERAIPWTVEQLRAGKPFPEWDEWAKL